MRPLARLWRDHRIALLAFVAAVFITLFFAVRLVISGVYWADPTHRDQVPEGWMTPGYVAHSWHVPRDRLIEILDLPRKPDHPMSFREIAEGRGLPLSDFLSEVSGALVTLKAEAPKP